MSTNLVTTPPSKILLNNTTNISLHDRFTKYNKEREHNKPTAAAATASSNNGGGGGGGVKTASVRNRRLAQQMANRPSVQAALKLKKRSIRQRVGGGGGGGAGGANAGIGARLGGGLRGRGRGRGRGGRGIVRGGVKRLGRGAAPIRSRLGVKPNPQSSASGTTPKPDIKSRLSGLKGSNQRINRVGGGGGGGNNRRGLMTRPRRMNGPRGGRVGRGFNRRGNFDGRLGGKGGPNQTNNNNNSINSNSGGRINKRRPFGRGRGGRGGRIGRGGRGGGGGGNRQNKQGAPNVDKLNNDLDQYMSKTKAVLNKDLDVYMSQTN